MLLLNQLYRYFVSLSSDFCHRNPLCCFSTSVYCCKRIFRYRLSSETFGYTLLYLIEVYTLFYFDLDSVMGLLRYVEQFVNSNSPMHDKFKLS
jgi:hypothetical protein